MIGPISSVSWIRVAALIAPSGRTSDESKSPSNCVSFRL